MMNVNELARQAWTEQRVLRIRYQKPEDCEVSEREVEVYGFNGVYLDTFCRLRCEPRTFRIDRILEARLLDIPFQWDPSIAAFLVRHGWTKAVAKPTVTNVPEKASGSSDSVENQTRSWGPWYWLRRLLKVVH
jgi:predicted DNA-binding transcriptional regulator YafY